MNEFNPNVLEADIRRLSQEVKDKKSLPEHKNTSERELLKQALYPHVQNYTQNTPASITPDDAAKVEMEVLPDYLKDSPDDIKLKVEELVDVAFKRGIEKGADEARKYGPFIFDAYHDAITDKVYEEMEKRKMI